MKTLFEKFCDDNLDMNDAFQDIEKCYCMIIKLRQEIKQQKFYNKHNMSIDQKISDEMDRLGKENEKLKEVINKHHNLQFKKCMECGNEAMSGIGVEMLDKIHKLRGALDCTSKELNEVLDQCYKDKNEEYYMIADKQYKLARSILKELGE